MFSIFWLLNGGKGTDIFSNNKKKQQFLQKFVALREIIPDKMRENQILPSRPSKRRHRIFHIALREELVLKI